MTYSQSITTRGYTFQKGMVVVCIHDHQVHDKLNYLNRYKVHSVDVDDLGQALVEVTTSAQKSELFPVEWFIPEINFDEKEVPAVSNEYEFADMEAKAKRVDERAMADPQPLVKRTDKEWTGPVTAAEIIAKDTIGFHKQAQQFENVPDAGSIIADNLAKMGKNPKQQYGDKKPRLTLAPLSAQIAQVEAQLDGMLKYGWVNWRINHIEAQTYVDAAIRHLRLYENGEDYARDTKVYNLGAVMACCAILIDSAVHDTLVDNRRHSPATCDMLHERGEAMVKFLQECQVLRELERKKDVING